MKGFFTIKPTKQLLKERGLHKGGKVQMYIDSECIRSMDKYTPKATGFMKDSVILGTVIGSGVLRYIASYARRNYYENQGRGMEGLANGGLRGRKWFERMKAVFGRIILDGAARLCGGKGKK